MYEINAKTETLVRSTDLYIKTGRTRTLHFRVHETIAPVVDDKFVAFPAPLLRMAEPKAKFVVRGSNEAEVINKFIALTRDVKRLNTMYEDSSQSDGE